MVRRCIVLEDAKHFLLQWVFGYAEMVVHGSLCSPADVERRGYVGCSPIDDLGELRPIAHVLEWHVFEWCSGEDKSVEALVGKVLEVAVVVLDVGLRRAFVLLIGYLHRYDFDVDILKCKAAADVFLSSLLDGHDVEEENFERILGCLSLCYVWYVVAG